jgi:hypothetical protein
MSKFQKASTERLAKFNKQELLGYIDWMEDLLIVQDSLLEHQRQLIVFQLNLNQTQEKHEGIRVTANEELLKDIDNLLRQEKQLKEKNE